jgi:hypothetical protein
MGPAVETLGPAPEQVAMAQGRSRGPAGQPYFSSVIVRPALPSLRSTSRLVYTGWPAFNFEGRVLSHIGAVMPPSWKHKRGCPCWKLLIPALRVRPVAEIVYGYAHGGNTAIVLPFEAGGRGPESHPYNMGGTYTANLGSDGKHIQFRNGPPMLTINIRTLLDHKDATKDLFVIDIRFDRACYSIEFARGNMYDHGDRLWEALMDSEWSDTFKMPEPWPAALSIALADARRKVIGDGDGIDNRAT